jgi:hypothetical protein
LPLLEDLMLVLALCALWTKSCAPSRRQIAFTLDPKT